MNQAIGDLRPQGGPGRKLLYGLFLLAALATVRTASAGAIRHHHAAHADARATLSASAADPWGAYWQSALQHHTMHVKGPRALSILSLSADGTLPESPLVQYLEWRQGLHASVFDSFHPSIAQLLKHVAHTPRMTSPTPVPTPSTPVLGGPPVPIQPPGFTPLSTPTSDEIISPPQVPEPSGFAVGSALIVAGAWARRRMSRPS